MRSEVWLKKVCLPVNHHSENAVVRMFEWFILHDLTTFNDSRGQYFLSDGANMLICLEKCRSKGFLAWLCRLHVLSLGSNVLFTDNFLIKPFSFKSLVACWKETYCIPTVHFSESTFLCCRLNSIIKRGN